MNSERNWAQELEELKLESAELDRETQAIQQEISGMFGPQDSSAVQVTLDDVGLVSAIDVDGQLAAGLPPQQLVDQVNLAIARAVAANGLPFLPSDPDSPFLAALFDGLSSGRTPEPERVSNDLKTVAVSAVLGTITRVECDPRWVASTSLTSFGDEIVRVARIAALQTDTLGKYTVGGTA